jgi:hypothetical protein
MDLLEENRLKKRLACGLEEYMQTFRWWILVFLDVHKIHKVT